MTPEQITKELADCKSTNRYLTDIQGDRFWVFGLPTGELLVRRVVDGIMKPVRTMQYGEVASIESLTPPDDIKIEPEVVQITFTAEFSTIREVSAGFVRYISIEFTDYGPHTAEDDERYCVSVRLRGSSKTPTGKLDKRSRDNGILICFNWSEYELAKEVLTRIGNENALRVLPYLEERIQTTKKLKDREQ